MRELGLTLTLTLTLALTLTLTLSLPHQDHLRELGLTTVGDRLYFIDLLTQVRRSRVTYALSCAPIENHRTLPLDRQVNLR